MDTSGSCNEDSRKGSRKILQAYYLQIYGSVSSHLDVLFHFTLPLIGFWNEFV